MSGIDLLIPQSALWYMLLVAVLTGIGLGVLSDGLFILRVLCRDPRARVSDTVLSQKPSAHRRAGVIGYAGLRILCDLLLALSASVTLMLLCYYTSDGQLRAPAVIGLAGGFCLYRKTASRILRRWLAFIIGIFFRGLHYVWAHTIGRLFGAVGGAVIHHRRNVHTTRRIEKLTRDAADGFGLSENISPRQKP